MKLKLTAAIAVLAAAFCLEGAMALPSTDGCKTTKKCLTFPYGCSPDQENCIFFSSSWNAVDRKFTMEVSGKGGYVGVAFGLRPEMADSDLYVCTATGLSSGSLKELHNPPTMQASLPAGVDNVQHTNVDGFVSCTFDRIASIEKNISMDQEEMFDLETNSYWVLVARGNVDGGILLYHYDDRYLALKAFNLVTEEAPEPQLSQQTIDNGECGANSKKCVSLTWSFNPTSQKYVFDLSGPATAAHSYVSVAFTSQPHMRNADVYFCYNGNRVVSGAINQQFMTPTIDTHLEGLVMLSGSNKDNRIRCTFERPISVTRKLNTFVGPGWTQAFSLDRAGFYLLFCFGRFNQAKNKPSYHLRNRWATKSVHSFYDVNMEPVETGCGVTKKCFFSRPGCSSSDPTCTVLAWIYDESQDMFHFDMRGGRGKGVNYAAIAFSLNSRMTNGDVYYCTGTQLFTANMTTRGTPPRLNAELPTDFEATTDNNVGRCLFSRPASVIRTVSGMRQEDFDLTKRQFYLLYAFGEFKKNAQYHGANKGSSQGPIDFKSMPLRVGCGVSKQCVSSVPACDPLDPQCVLLSWRNNENSNTVDFEFSGGMVSDDQYVSVGFSPSGTMMDSDIYYCAKSNLGTAVIGGRHSPPVPDTMRPAGVTNVIARTDNGAKVCSFTRAASITKEINGNDVDFDLSTNFYFALFCKGSFAGNQLNQHSVADRWTSFVPIDFIPQPPIDFGCGEFKGCLTNINGCDPGSKGCIFLAWRYNEESNTFDIEFSGGMVSAGDYFSIAFSESGTMAESEVYYCAKGRLGTAVIGARHTPPIQDSSLPAGVTNVKVRERQGVTICSFTRAANISKEINSNDVNFDLFTTMYHVLFCTGSFAGDRLNQHSASNRWSSPEAIRFIPQPPINFGCGETKDCASNVFNCDPTDPNCIILSWRYNGDSNTFDIEFSGSMVAADQYFSIAFAPEGKMQNADVYYCSGGQLKTAVIGSILQSIPIEEDSLPLGVTNVRVRVHNGVTTCSFTRAASIDKKIDNEMVPYNLVTTPYYVLYCRGQIENNKLKYHGMTRWLSPQAIMFGPPLITSGCGQTKTCHSNVKDCKPYDEGCIYFTYKYNGDLTYDIEVSGGMVSPSQYVSVGFAPEAKMMNADIYYCSGDKFGTAVIGQRYSTPVPDSTMPTEVTNARVRIQNGATICTFTRAANVAKEIEGSIVNFNIANTKFNLLFCKGAYAGRMLFHGINKWASSQLSFAPPPISQGCGVNKNCIKNKKNCNPGDAGCILFTWKYNGDQTYNIEFSGGMVSSDHYVSIAFSPTGMMMDSEVYYCAGGKLGSGLIGFRHQQPSQDSSLPAGVTNALARTENGTVTCSFTRAVSITKQAKIFDFASTPFHMLFCTGSFTDNTLRRHSPTNRWNTPSAIHFGCGSTTFCATNIPGCTPTENGDCIFMSALYNKASDNFLITIIGPSSPGYAAIAFAPKAEMKDADLYYCADGNLKSGAITTKRPPLITANLPAGITSEPASGSSANGLQTCTFTRAASITKTVSSNKKVDFNLALNKYHILFAKGRYLGGRIGYHSKNRWASPTSFDFIQPSY